MKSANLKLYIKTFGCQMNTRDSEALLGMFLDRGYSAVDEPAEADLILVNTCSVREHAENRALSFLGSLKKVTTSPGHKVTGSQSHNVTPSEEDEKSPNIQYARPTTKIIGLIGCMAKNIGKNIFKKMPHINLICSPSSLSKIPDYVDKILNEKIRIIDLGDGKREEVFYSSLYRLNKDHAFVVISTGCSNYCSYCVVPFTRGSLNVRAPSDIIKEIENNISLGIRKITLLGQNVNDYEYTSEARSQKSEIINFINLLRKIDEIEGLEELDFITAHPKNTSRELFQVMAGSAKIKKHLHIPFQSGSNRILKLMNRGYSREEYLQLTEDYKKITGGTLSTDVIVGFPTETEEDFLKTKEVLEYVQFSSAYIFKYSPRPQTGALNFKDDILDEIKSRRHRILLNLQKDISLHLIKK